MSEGSISLYSPKNSGKLPQQKAPQDKYLDKSSIEKALEALIFIGVANSHYRSYQQNYKVAND
jgi:hypothetical protein